MGLLSDILGGAADDRFKQFLGTSTDAAKPVPLGSYPCRVTKGEFHTAGTGNKGYRLTFEIQGGEYAGRKLWKTYFFTDAALAFSRAELARFGLVEERDFAAFPGDAAIACTVFVAVMTSDRGEANDVKRVTDIGPAMGRTTGARPVGERKLTGKPVTDRGKSPSAGAPATKAAPKKPAGGEGGDSPTKARVTATPATTATKPPAAKAKGTTRKRKSPVKTATGRKGGDK